MRRKPAKNQPPAKDKPASVPVESWFSAGDFRTALGVCAFLLLAVVLVFRQTANFDFVNFDDNEYVYENPEVMQGLTWHGIGWAMTACHSSNWHPLTWISHELDCSIYGQAAGGHHLTSVLLHAACAILLFLVLWRMTGGLWPSAFVAAVFAVHPLRVESVAWISERKDVLSGLFFMLTLAAYVRYVRRPFSWGRYLAVVALFALGLMAKPMLVTLPFVLLLLDYWPLGRMLPQRESWFPWRLVAEKIPLLLLTAASCIATPLAQGKAVAGIDAMPIYLRICNALVSYVAYIGDFVFPVGLAVFYPHPGANLPVWKAVAALLVLVVVSAAAIVGRRKFPYLFVGWFWYVGMLLPVIGIVQVGGHAMADRYTYLPQIGLGIAVAWGTADLTRGWAYRGWACGVAAGLIVATLMGCAWQQTGYWRDSVSLWKRALECTSHNARAEFNLGAAWEKLEEHEKAIEQYEKALALQPNYVDAHYNLGVALAALGRVDEAIGEYRNALKIDDRHAKAHYRLADALADRGENEEAIAEFQKTLEIEPGYANAYYSIGGILNKQGNTAEAMKWWEKALQLAPTDVVIMDQIAWTLATCPDASLRNGEKAVQLAERAVQLCQGTEATPLGTLAAAYAEAGRFAEAVEATQQAIALAEEENNREAADSLRARLKLYRAKAPYRQRGNPHE